MRNKKRADCLRKARLFLQANVLQVKLDGLLSKAEPVTSVSLVFERAEIEVMYDGQKFCFSMKEFLKKPSGRVGRRGLIHRGWG